MLSPEDFAKCKHRKGMKHIEGLRKIAGVGGKKAKEMWQGDHQGNG